MNARPTKILLASVLVASLGCSSAPEARKALPGLPLAESLAAQAAFRPLLKRWSAALTREERTLVAQDVRKFLAKYPKDGQTPAAEALLAWSAVEWGDLVSGRRMSRAAQNLGPGSWQDFTFLIDGAIRRRNGDAASALNILEPLVSTLIDAWARDLLNEEVIAAAIRAQKPALAVKTMSIWLREAGDEERLLVRARVERALKTVGDADLIKVFDERTARGGGGTENALDLLLVERIAKIAIDTRDAILAKKLLATSGSLLGSRGDEVARLAAGAAAIRIDARTIGLLLSFRNSDTRRRSAEVAAGVTWGLKLPGSGARLVVRNDAGELENTEDALTELGRDGAAVIIAGIAEEDARVAARFASNQNVPVVLIVRPPDVRAVHIGPAPAPAAPDDQNAQPVFSFSLNVAPEGFKPLPESRFVDWTNAFGTKPTFWAAAGRDAATIALQSVKDLPEATTEDAAEVKSRRNTVRAALNTPVTETLWTPPVDATTSDAGKNR